GSPHRRLRRDCRLVRDPGEGRTLARQPLPESAGRTRRLTALEGRRVRAEAAFLPHSLRPSPHMTTREGSLEAPTRHPLDWKSPAFYDPARIEQELGRVFDICHGCRRCVNLCTAFPRLFDLIDEGPTGELDGVPKERFREVVDQCYLCDMCYMTKCPYVPPHPWNVDFPHVMLRAKAAGFRKHGAKLRDRLLSSTDALGKLAT